MRKLRVGDVLRVPYRGRFEEGDQQTYSTLTRGVHERPADHQKGIFYYEQFSEPGQTFPRIPAFILHVNPYKRGAETTPWVDIVEPDDGYCLFHGDNRTPQMSPSTARGNKKLVDYLPFFTDANLRRFAPPLLVFQQVDFNGTRRGYRKFCGYGVPVRSALITQKTKGGESFTNITFELALFRLDYENELFPWAWIDARRDRSTNADAALEFAPRAWKLWVKRGSRAIENCRRLVARQSVVGAAEQSAATDAERKVLSEVLSYHEQKKHEFEGLASFVTQRVLGARCRRGWVTRRSGDGGVDFVSRLDVGDPTDRLSRTSVVVLGQAKCVEPHREISGHDLARVVARLQRGWMGAYVTTGRYSRAAQLELALDKYPIVLINGPRLARILLEVMVEERIDLHDILERESKWYEAHATSLHPVRVLDDASLLASIASTPLGSE